MPENNPFAYVADALGNLLPQRDPNRLAARSGTIMGFLDELGGVETTQARAARNVDLAREEREGVRQSARDKEARELQAAEGLARRFQELVAEHGGDVNQATSSILRDPAFVQAFSSGNVDTLIKQIRSLSSGPVDPGMAIARGLTPQGSQSPLVEQTFGPQRGSLAEAANMNPEQVRALQESARLNPAGAQTAASAALNARAFPGPEAEPQVDQATSRERAKILGKIATDGNAAVGELTNLRQLRTSLDNIAGDFPTGTWRGIAAKYGINVGRQTTDIQIVQALVDRLTPAQRQGLPGAASDRDVAMFRSSLPDLMRTPEGNRQIIDTLEALAESRVNSGRVAGSVFAGANPAQVWNDLQALPDPLTALEQRRTQRLSEVEGLDFSQVPRLTRPQLRNFIQDVVKHYGGQQNIPPRVQVILRRRAAQIDEAGR